MRVDGDTESSQSDSVVGEMTANVAANVAANGRPPHDTPLAELSEVGAGAGWDRNIMDGTDSSVFCLLSFCPRHRIQINC